MRRLLLLAGLLAAPVLPVLAAAPAHAVDNVICVLPATTGCNQTFGTIGQAINAATANSLDDTILLGATTYSDGPYVVQETAHALTLEGAGQGSTFITLPANAAQQDYLNVSHATVSDLTVTMAAGQSTNDHGLTVGTQTVVDHVTVNGTGTFSAIGIYAGLSTVMHSIVNMPPDNASGNRGIYSSGGNTVTDSTLSGAQAFDLSDPNTTDTLSRVALRGDNAGVLTDAGSIVIDDAVIDLGTADNSTGLAAVNFNNSPSLRAITANHVTIVGGGVGSRGVWAYAGAPGAVQNATIGLTNSIVRGPATSLVVTAGNDGAQGAASTATVTVSYTDYQNKTSAIAPTTGAGGIVEGSGNLVDVPPGFVSASDRHLTPGSGLVDKGNPAPGAPVTDLDGLARVLDGDGNGSAIRDMGAYELPDTTAPDTVITSGPVGTTGDSTPTFSFSSEDGSTFECKLDAAAYAACPNPFTTQPLPDGDHTLLVRATDLALNVDATPASRTWHVDTTPPDTSIASGPTGATHDATPTFSFTSEAGATFRCKLDDAAEAACSSPFTTSKLVDGPHTLVVVAVDTVGNRDATPATRHWVVDTTPPVVTIKKAPKKQVTSARVKVKFVWDRDGGADTVECRLDKGDWKTCTSPYKANVKVGKHTIEIRVTDAAGNTGVAKKVKFKRIKP